MDLTNHYTRFPTEPLQPISVIRNSLHLRCVHTCVFSCVRLFVTPWTTARQASLSMEFSRQEYWSGLPFPTPRDLPNPGIKPVSLVSPALAGEFLTTAPLGKSLDLKTTHWISMFPSVGASILLQSANLPVMGQCPVCPVTGICNFLLTSFPWCYGLSFHRIKGQGRGWIWMRLSVKIPYNLDLCSNYDLLLLFSHSVVSNSLRLHGMQHVKLPCPSPSPRACSNSCPLSWWCHPTISSSVIPFFSCLQSFPASRSFLMSQVFASSGQSIVISTSASGLLMNIQDWFPLGSTGLISFDLQLWYISLLPL